jgi:hypothetical protein
MPAFPGWYRCALALSGAKRIGGGPDPEIAQREFHDVLMHAESRHGLTARPIGLYPFAGRFEPTKAIRDEAPGTSISLHRPDLEKIRC